MGLLDGYDVFGVATSFIPTIDPTAEQINAFFGINGIQSLHGGSRGFTMLVSGAFFGLTPGDVLAQEAVLLSYHDGIGRTLVDNLGNAYLGVIFSGAYQRWEYGVKPAYLGPAFLGGWALAYKAAFRGLGG